MTLHIYGQELWHEPAFIVGDRESLQALAKAIEIALSRESGSASAQTMTEDGEGYITFVIARDPFPTELALPYNDQSIVPFTGESPYDLLSKEELHKLYHTPDVG